MNSLQTGTITDTIAFLDNNLLEIAGVGTTYVLRGEEIAIVETGTSISAPAILAGLVALGIDPVDVRHILLTHVHMDHAGGAGVLVKSMPDARVYLHSLTHEHLIDPSRLLSSAARALGDLFPRHGTIVPLEPERLFPAEHLRLDLGRGIVVQAVLTPGHSADHIAYYEQGSASLFCGDALGISLPRFDYSGPVTPPPAYDVTAQQQTFQTLLSLPIEHVLFSHWGESRESPAITIRRMADSYEHFDRLVRAGIDQGHIDQAAIVQAMLPDKPLPPDGAWIIEGWITMGIRGLERYYTKLRSQAYS